jgi:hypothetical protein
MWYCEQRSGVGGFLVAICLCREANYTFCRAKRYERLMKANGIHPNGGPSTPSPMTAPPATKALSKASIAKAAAAKKRKIEGTSASRMKQDEEEDDALVKPKLEPFPQQLAHLAVKAEPVADPGMSFATANFTLSSNPTATMEHATDQQQFDSANSIFEEFCVPEMFPQHGFEEAVVKAEQQPQHLPLQQPYYMPSPPPAMVERFKQFSNPESRGESGKGPQESIIIAD